MALDANKLLKLRKERNTEQKPSNKPVAQTTAQAGHKVVDRSRVSMDSKSVAERTEENRKKARKVYSQDYYTPEEHETYGKYDTQSGQAVLDHLRDINRQATELDKKIGLAGGYGAMAQSYDKDALERELNELVGGFGGTGGLSRTIQGLERTQRQAEKYNSDMSLIRVNDPASEYYDKDFDTLALADGAVTDSRYRWINDEQYRRQVRALQEQARRPEYTGSVGEVQDAQRQLSDLGVYSTVPYEESGLDLMTADEIATYNYHYAKGGAEQAQRYLDAIADSLNRRKAQQMYAGMEGHTAKELAFGIDAGFDQFLGGVQGVFSDKEQPVSSRQYASESVRQDLADAGPKLPEWMGGASLGQMAYDTVTTTTNMAPSILASVAANAIAPGSGFVGTGLMGASAGGNAKQEALRDGYSESQANAYGWMIGISETCLQEVLGGISKLGGGGLGKIADTVSGGKFTAFLNKLDNALLRTAAELGESMMSEGSEEYLQEILEPMMRNAALGEDNELELVTSDAIYSGLLGALTGGLMEGPNIISRNVQESRQGREAATEAESTEQTVDPLERAALEMQEQTGPVENDVDGVDASKTESTAPELEEASQKYGAQAPVMVSSYQHGQDVQQYDREFQVAFEQGKNGVKWDYTANSEAIQDLTEEQRERAWKAGRSAGGWATMRGTDEAVKVKGVVDSDGGLALELEDGRIVKHGDVNLPTASEELALRGIEGLKVNAEDANSLMDSFREGDVTGDIFAQGVQAAFQAGGKNIPMQELSRNTSAAAALSESQRNTAYKLGQKYAETKAQQEQAALTGTAKEPGRVHYDGDVSKLTEIQQTSVSALETVADALGVQIYLYESQVGENGVRQGANGWYNTKTGDIHIDIHAGQSGKGTMLFTASHELTHFVKQWSPAKFKALADFLMEQYGEKGVSVEELIERQQAKAKRAGRELDYDAAFEELVADSMESMLADGDIVEKLARLKQQDKSLWQKLKEKVSELVRKLKQAYKGLKPDSAEGKYVAEMLDAAEELKRLFTEGLEDAGRRFRGDGTATEESSDTPVNATNATDNAINASDNATVSNTETAADYDGIYDPSGDGELDFSLREPVEGVKFSIRDTEYLDAVEREDMQTAQRMVDEAAERWGAYRNNEEANSVFHQDGKVRTFYHGTNTGDFTSFDSRLLGSSSGDLGWFGKGFYFAFSHDEAATYGRRVIPAYLKMRNPFDYSQLYKFNGSDKGASEYARFAWLYNITKRFPDITQDQRVWAYPDPDDPERGVAYSWSRLADEMDRIRKEVQFTVEEVEQNDGTTAVELRADPKKNSWTSEDGETFEWTEYGMSQLFATEKDAKEPINQIGAYLENVLGIAPIPRGTIEDIDFSGAVQRAGYDGILQSMSGDEAVVFSPEQIKTSEPVTYDDNGNVIPLSERFNSGSKDIRYSIREKDSEGNELTEEQKEFFKDSKVRLDSDGEYWYGEGALAPVYHATDEDFTVFLKKHLGRNTDSNAWDESYAATSHIGFWFNTKDLSGGKMSFADRSVKAYLNITNPYHAGTLDGLATEIAGMLPESTSPKRMAKEYIAYLKNHGYDGIVINDEEMGGMSFAAFESNQIKRTDNLAPTGRKDIRYSERDPAVEKLNRALEKENSAQKEEIGYLRDLVRLQHKVTNGTKFTRSSVRTLAKKLMNEAGATGNYLELSEMLNGVYEYIASLSDPAVAPDWEDIAERTGEAAQWLMDHVEVKPDRGEYANDILKELRTRRISLNEGQMAEAASRYGSYNDFRKATFGSFVLAKDGTPLDVVWQDLAAQYPSTFDTDVGDADMPLKLAEIVEGLRDTDLAAEEWQYQREDLQKQMQQAVYDGYWKVSTLRTVADIWKDRMETADTAGRAKLEKQAESYQKQINELKQKNENTSGKLAQARSEIAKLNAEHAESIRQLRKEKREGIRTAQAETAERYRDARKKATEGRHKTAERRKIEKTVNGLEKLLLRGDKKRNVKEGMRNFVEEALNSANALFAGTYSDEELVLNGVGTELTKEEQELLSKAKTILTQKQDLLSDSAIAEESEAVAVGDTTGYDERMRLVRQLDQRLKPVLKELNGVFQRERARLNKATVGAVLANLSAAYRSLGQSDDVYIRGAAREEVWQHLDSLAETLGGATASDMTLEQLKAVSDAFTMVLTTVRKANELFTEGQRQTLSETARTAAQEVTSNGRNSRLGVKLVEELKKFGINNLKPVYFFEHLNSNTLRQLYKGLMKGQDGWAVDVSEAREYFLQAAERSGMKEWDMEKTHTFRAASGEEFKLNLQQIMSLYAYSRRDQARDHLRKGGIVIDSETDIEEVVEVGGKFKVKLKGKSNDATAYNIDDVTLDEIISKLTKEQKVFVEEMQSYLSDVMGGKGNEVSMKLYGVKQFKEANYFPLKSAQQYMVRAKEQAEQTNKVKNAGFTKATVQKASNPVVLTPFMDVWSDHVNEMGLYHSMTIPLEDLYRVYTFSQTGDGGQASQSVTAAIENAFGKQATDYFDQLMKDLNGGARVDNTTGLINKSMGLFKKGSVFLSASVVIQQPSAILRATALVDSKYFQWVKIPAKWAADLTWQHNRHDRLWAELKQYAPVALIKEMGYFDTNMGRTTRDFIQAQEYNGFREKMQGLIHDSGYRDEVMSKAPALADELAWCSIWEAVKRETADRHKDVKVGSEEFLKLAGERFTEVIDRTQVYDSVLARSANMRSKDTGMKMATAFMAEPTVSANMTADAILKAKRGDKKFARRAIGSVISSGILNAMLYSLVAAARDDDEGKEYWEKYLGSVTGEVFEVINPLTYLPFGRGIWSLVQGYDVERSDMALVADLVNAFRALGSDSKTGLEKVEGFTDTVLKIFNLPLGNVWRDVKALYNVFEDTIDGQGSTAAGIGYAVMENIPFGKAASNGQQLYEATIKGDQEHVERVTARFKDESAAQSALRKALRENDPRIREAAVAWNEGRLEDYVALAKEVIAEKRFTQDDVVMSIRAEANSLLPDEENESSAAKHKGLFTTETFAVAAADGDSTMMKAIREDLIQTAVSNGKNREEAEKSVESSIKSELKDCVLDGLLTDQKARAALTGYCGMDAAEAEETVVQWKFETEHGYKWSERMDRFVEAAVDGSGDAKAIRDDVIAAGIAGGQSREEAEAAFQSSFRSALGELYDAEGVSDKQAVSLLEKYGGKDSESALTMVRYWEFRRDNPGVNVDDSWIDKYYSEIESSGMDIETYVSYRDQVKSITGSNKKEGRMAVIDSLPISNAQKDALYYAEGWAKSRIGEAPWH